MGETLKGVHQKSHGHPLQKAFASIIFRQNSFHSKFYEKFTFSMFFPKLVHI